MKKTVLKLILAAFLLLTVSGIIIYMNSQYKQLNSSKEVVNNTVVPVHKADDLVDRSMLIQITEQNINNAKEYHINLSEDGVLFKYMDSNINSKDIYDRYEILAEKQLSLEQKKSLEKKISELKDKEDIDSEKLYTILYAGEEKNVDMTELNNALAEYGITF